MMMMMTLITADMDDLRYDDVGDDYDDIQNMSRCEDDR